MKLALAILVTLAVAYVAASNHAAADHIVLSIDNLDKNPDGIHLEGVNYPWLVEGQPYKICTDYESLPQPLAQAIADWDFVLPGGQFVTSCVGNYRAVTVKHSAGTSGFPCEPYVGCVFPTWEYDAARGGYYFAGALIWVDDAGNRIEDPGGFRALFAHEIGHLFGLDEAYHHDWTCNDGRDSVMDALKLNPQTNLLVGCDGPNLSVADMAAVDQLYTLNAPSQVTYADRGSRLLMQFQETTRAEGGYQVQVYRLVGSDSQFVHGWYDATSVAPYDHYKPVRYVNVGGGALDWSWELRASDPEGFYTICMWSFSWVQGFQHWTCTPWKYLWPPDSDGDGYTDWNEAGKPLCQNTFAAPGNEDMLGNDWAPDDGCDIAGSASESGSACLNSTNDDPWDDPISNDGCPQVGAFSEAQFKINTYRTDGCGDGNAWPADLVGGSFSEYRDNIQDLASYVAVPRRMNTSPGDSAFWSRYDVVPGPSSLGYWINVIDLQSVTYVAPPMAPYYGSYAFNGPPCTP